MFPHQVEFPKFVPDQLLTSSDLNNMFGYLDEQNRLTRTNLIGIGIVCGLQLKINAALTDVVITKGCGVTSAGYLITFKGNEAFPYKKYKKYEVETPRVYDKFYKTVGPDKVPMEVWELRNTATDADWLDLGPSFLSDKVILLFVELKEEDNKNCDPNSCDDKGINVTVSFLPMVVSKADADLLIGTTGGSSGINTYTTLPEMRMKRWDVPNTAPVYSQEIFEGYFKLLDKPFIDKVESTLGNIYAVFGATVAPSYTSNPFQGLSEKLKFLYDGSISVNQLIHLQYYYDFFSDLFLAYQEFRKAGTLVLSTCCPDEDLFPRHLLLGEASPSATSGLSAYRHHFIHSPLFDQKGMLPDLWSLFMRLKLMVDQLFMPPVSGGNGREDSFLRITPSRLWDVPLSVKAIPYYYRVNVGTDPLYRYWNAQRTLLNDATRNLSYHSPRYNAVDDFVTNPLHYDLEPYNFLRVEGIVGKPYVHVLKQVKQQIQKNRLPIDIIALSTDLGAVLNRNEAANKRDATGMLEMLCHFQDLESMYDSLKSEILCELCKELKYYYDFTLALFANVIRKQTIAGEVSQVPLFDVCSKGYVIKGRSLGMMIEFLYRKGLTDETLTIESFFEALGLTVDDVNNDDVPDGLNTQMTTLYMVLLNFFRIPLGIIRLSTLLTDDLDEFDEKAYCNASEKLGEYAKSLKAIFGILTANQKADLATGGKKTNPDGATTTQPAGTSTNSTGTETQVRVNALASNRVLANLAATGNGLATILLLIFMIEDFMDHLDELIYSCRCGALRSLKRDFLSRYLAVSRLRQFGYFTKMHPGIQHKAGVPIGGTFIVVYHSRKRRVVRNPTVGIRGFAEAPKSENKIRSVANGTASMRRTTQVGGVVMDESNAPILGASLTVAETGEGITTNAQGIFKFASSVVPYTLIVEAAGFEGYEEVKTDDDTKIQIRLGTFEGNALDEISPGIVIADFYLPYRCCSDCPPIQYIINDKTPTTPTNNGPIANAGPDQEITLPTSQVTLNGSGSSDADGTITSFQWTKLSGPSDPTFATQASSQTDVSNLKEGVYLIELTVTDNGGSIARDTVQVTVNPPPPPENKNPIAEAGPDQTVTFVASTATSVILDGSQSKDEDGTIVAFSWSQVSGPSTVNIASSTLAQTPALGFQQLGVYVFQLLVTDNQGATGQDTVTITLTPRTNQPPLANAGNDQTVTLSPANNIVTLNGGSSSDPDGDTLSFQWKWLSGPTTPTITDPTKVQTTVSGFTSGKYEFALTVDDGKGGVAGDTVSVSVIFQEQPPKSCGPLADIVAAIDEQNSYPNDLPKFHESFQYYEEVMAYFKELGTIQGESSDKHLEFFSNPFKDQSTPELIIKWLTELQKFILEGGDLRKVALLFYRILNLLSMYIVCIQKEDFDVAKVPMNRVFAVIQSHLKAWGPQVEAGAFDAESMEWLKRMAEDVKKEAGRVSQNGESSTKTKYFKVLQTILSLLEAML